MNTYRLMSQIDDTAYVISQLRDRAKACQWQCAVMVLCFFIPAAFSLFM